MDELVTAMMEHVCNNRCRFQGERENQEELEGICVEYGRTEWVFEPWGRQYQRRAGK